MATRPVVLLVEDHALLRAAFVRTITSLDCDLFVSEDPLNALKRLEDGLRPTMILSDLQMPHMEGDEFCRIIREKYPEIRFTLISGHPSVYKRGHDAGAHHAYMKPIHRELLELLILGDT